MALRKGRRFKITVFPNMAITGKRVPVLGENPKRVGLIVAATGTSAPLLYDQEGQADATVGFSMFNAPLLAFLQKDTCPQGPLWATGGAADSDLGIIEIVEEDIG